MKCSVTIHSITGLDGHSGLFNKTDPYVECEYGSWHKFHTKTKKDAGSEAMFEETHAFDVKDHTQLRFKARDAKHLKLDKTLAEGAFTFEPRVGYYYNGVVGLVNKHHCKEPALTITVKVE